MLVLTGPPDPHDMGSMAYFRSLQALRGQLGVEKEMRFVFESGSNPGEPHLVDAGVVGDLFRVSDLMFLPSHREGFAMPVLEAGLVGIPVVCTEVPAAVEIGGEDVIGFDLDEAPDRLAARILAWAEGSPVHRLRRRVRPFLLRRTKQQVATELPDKTEIAQSVELDKVLFVGDGQNIKVGKPYIDGAKVIATFGATAIDSVVKGPKLYPTHLRKRKASKRRTGHRQKYLQVTIEEIQA